MNKVKIYTDGFEGFRKRALERARKLDRGEKLEPEHSITLDASAFKVFTAARLRLFQQVKKERQISITSLAERLKRPREAVSRDVKALTSIGLLKVRDVSNPGHGRLTMVAPAAGKVSLEL